MEDYKVALVLSDGSGFVWNRGEKSPFWKMSETLGDHRRGSAAQAGEGIIGIEDIAGPAAFALYRDGSAHRWSFKSDVEAVEAFGKLVVAYSGNYELSGEVAKLLFPPTPKGRVTFTYPSGETATFEVDMVAGGYGFPDEMYRAVSEHSKAVEVHQCKSS